MRNTFGCRISKAKLVFIIIRFFLVIPGRAEGPMTRNPGFFSNEV